MKYLFYISKLYSIPIIKPLIDYLKQQNSEYKILAAAKIKQAILDLNIYSEAEIITTLKEGKKFQPDFCLAPGNYIDWRLPGIKVEIFHGIGIEKESHYKIRGLFDVYLTSGPLVTRRFLEMQKKLKYFLVKETGWSKVDYIVNYPTENLKEKLKIPADKKVILYAPTFSRKLESGSALLKHLPQIIKDDEICLMKFHELMDKELVDYIKKCDSKKIRIVETYDITPYLHVSDVMISDTSSVVYEFMLLDKPVITFKTSSRKDKGIDLESAEGLRTALDRSLVNPGELSLNRKAHLSEVNPYLSGEISANVFKALAEIKLNNELKGKRKPLNLFRKLKIYYKQLRKS